MAPPLEAFTTLLGVVITIASLGALITANTRRLEHRLHARLTADTALLASRIDGTERAAAARSDLLEASLTGRASTLEASLTGQISTLDARLEAVEGGLERVDMRLEKLDDRVYVLAARLGPMLDERTNSRAPGET